MNLYENINNEVNKYDNTPAEIMCEFIGTLFVNEGEGFYSNEESLYDWCEGGDCFRNAGFDEELCETLDKALLEISPLVGKINDILRKYDNRDKFDTPINESSLKESGSILDPAFTVCYNTLDVFPTRKSAADFYKTCMSYCEGAERERYTNIYLDLMDGSDVGYDGVSDKVWEIRWHNGKDLFKGDVVSKEKLESTSKADEIIKKIKSGKIMPPKEFLDVIDADMPKIEEGQKLKETFKRYKGGE